MKYYDIIIDQQVEKHIESILAYMYVTVKMAKEKGIKLTREYLYSLGKDIKYYDGVTLGLIE